jgi:hypothetical protein
LPTDLLARGLFMPQARFRHRRDLTWILLMATFVLPAITLAQDRRDPEASPPQRMERERREGNQTQSRGPAGGGVFRRLRELPPAEQRRFMATNPEFQNFGPMRQQLIRERLRQWDAMTPQEKERVRQREEIFESLSPEQRREARDIFPQWRDLPPGRRQALMVAFRHLRDLPPDQRQAFLESQQVREEFSPHERDILGGLNHLLPTSPAKAPDSADPPEE